MILSKWKRRRSSREIERTRFENRVRTVVQSDDKSLMGKEVFIEKDLFVNKADAEKWRYSIPLPKDHPIKKQSPYASYKMCCGIETREVAMMLADIEAADMGYAIIKPFELINDVE